MKKIIHLLVCLSLATSVTAQCVSGDCDNGFGVYKDSLFLYEGQFKNQLPHGKGRLAKANGDLYTGGFAYGMYNGTGTLYGRDNSMYTGSFHQGLKQGQGSITYGDGKKYEGLFNNNKAVSAVAVVHQMNFYSGKFEKESLADIDIAWQRIHTQEGDFDLNTGSWLPSPTIMVFKIKDEQGYYHGNKYYFSRNGNVYDRTPIPKPAFEKNVSSSSLMCLSGLDSVNSYFVAYAVTLKPKSKKDYTFRREARICKIDRASQGIQEINRLEVWSGASFDDYTQSVQSATGSSFYLPRFKVVYSNYGKNEARLEKTETNFSTEYQVPGNKNWFSANGDTLYELDRGLQLTAFDVHTGKIIRSRRFSNNHFQTGEKGLHNIPAIISADEQSMKFVAIDGSYLNYISTIGDNSYNYNKAVLLDLNDPDYMLPLTNPLYSEEYFAAISKAEKEEYAAYEAFQAAERKKVLETPGRYSRRTSLFTDLDNDDSRSANTTRRKTSLSRQDMDKIISANSSSAPSGESGWDKLFREREKQSNKDYRTINGQ